MSKPTTSPEAQAAMDALVAMMRQDRQGVVDAVGTILKGGASDTYAALCGWAAVAAQVMIEGGHEGDYYLEVTDARTGQQIGLDDTSLPGAHRDALRMITAFKNDDHAMFTAMFKPYWESDTDELFELITSMLTFATAAAKHHMEGKHRGDTA